MNPGSQIARIESSYTQTARAPGVPRDARQRAPAIDRPLSSAPAVLPEPHYEVSRFAQLHSLGPIAYLTFSDQSIVRELNETAATLLRTSAAAIEGFPFTQFVPHASVPQFLDHLRRCRDSRQGKVRTVLELKVGNDEVTVELESVRFSTLERTFLSAIVPLSDRQTAQEALTAARDLAQSIFEFVPHPLLVLDDKSQVVTINSAFCERFRTSSLETVGRTVTSLPCVQFITDIGPVMASARLTGLPQEHEVHARLEPNRSVTLLVSARRMATVPRGGQGVVLALQDITARKAADARNEQLVIALRKVGDELEGRVTERAGQLKAANERLQSLSRKLVEAQETERRRIARELHDDIGQELTAVKISLNNLRRQLPGDSLAQFEESTGSISNLLERVRAMALEIRPQALDDVGLLAALRSHISTFSARTGIAVKFTAAGVIEPRINQAQVTALFRVAQEALTNVARHAATRTARVSLYQDRDAIRLRVSDNGSGFAINAKPKGNECADGKGPQSMGLAGMQERASLLGGQFQIQSAPRKGTQIQLILPLGPTPQE